MHYAAIRSFAIVVTPHAAPHSRTTTAARVSQLYAILTLTSAESQVRSPLCCHDRRGNRRMPPPPSLLLPSTALAKEGKNERSSYCLANLGNTKFSGASSYSIGFFGKTVVYYRHCMKCLSIYFFKEFIIMGGHRFNYRFYPWLFHVIYYHMTKPSIPPRGCVVECSDRYTKYHFKS